MYLTAVTDWNTKAVLVYKLSNSMDATLVTDVLNEALSKSTRSQKYSTQIKAASTQAMNTPKVQIH